MNRWYAALIAAVMLVSGCTKDTATSSDTTARAPENPQITRLRALPFGDAAMQVVTEVLSNAGVGLHDDNVEVKTGKAVRVTRWQASNLAVEAANGGGMSGAEISALAPVRQGVPPVQYLLAAWVKSYDSSAAKFARDLMGEQDWQQADQILFPGLVITLFLADATDGIKVPSAPKANGMALAAMTSAGVCTFAATFIQHAIATVVSVLKVDTSGGGFFGFLGKIWNVAVDLLSTAAQALITTFTKPIVDLVVDTFGVLAMITQLSSFLVKWRADIRPEPSHTFFGVDPAVVTGQFKLTVTQNQLPIPDFIVECAGAFGVDLRNAGSAAGSKVTWTGTNTGRADLSTRTGADNVLAQDKTARYRYQTGQESQELAKSKDTQSMALIVSASVHRNDVQKARELFEHLLLNQIDERIRPIVASIVEPLRSKADSQLRAITDVSARARAYITYHVPDKTPTPTPPSGTGSGANGKKAIWPASCPHPHVIYKGFPRVGTPARGPWEFDGAILPGNLTPPGGRTCGYSSPVGPVDPVTNFQQVEQVGLYLMLETEPTPDNARTVIIPGTERAWLDGGLRVVVDGHTLAIEIRAVTDPEPIAIEVAKAVLGLT